MSGVGARSELKEVTHDEVGVRGSRRTTALFPRDHLSFHLPVLSRPMPVGDVTGEPPDPPSLRTRRWLLGPCWPPSGDGLLERVRENVRNTFQSAGWDGTLEQEIEEWASLYPGESIDLERVLAYSHRKHHLRLLGSDEYFEHGSRSIVAARSAIQRILTDATPIATPSLYREFALRLSPRDVVLTFNYDTLLEQTLDHIGNRTP